MHDIRMEKVLEIVTHHRITRFRRNNRRTDQLLRRAPYCSEKYQLGREYSSDTRTALSLGV